MNICYYIIYYPLVSTIFYLITCFMLGLFRERLGYIYKNNVYYQVFIKFSGIMYNLIMTLFSGIICFVLSVLLLQEYNTVFNHNIFFIEPIIKNKDILNICWIFCHSKIIEFFDTYFILLKGGKPIFLQKFHHIGAVWMWYLVLTQKSSFIIGPTLFNSFVHTVMYLYYMLSILDKNKLLNCIKPFITLLQIIQLSYGTIAGISYITYHYDTEFMVYPIIFLIYTTCMVLLFLNFSYNQYFIKYNKNK